MFIGLVGMVLIIIAWIVSFKNIPPLSLSILYGAGSALLTLHAYMIGDNIFMLLNLIATLISLVNIVRAVRRNAGKYRGLKQYHK